MNRSFIYPAVALLTIVSISAAADEVRVANMPPVVINTIPQAGDLKVDPSTTEIRVTFSKDMMDGSWSWTQMSDDTFPPTTGKPRYLSDKRTCVLPVKLEPNRSYVTWLNSAKFGNFRDTDGRSAVPYLLVFETGKGRGWGPEQATGEPDTPQAGDIPTAWASLGADDQREWLMLDYAKAVKPMAIHVHETYNPGALTKVSVFGADGQETVVWEGIDPTPSGSGKGVSKIAVTGINEPIKRVKLYLDSPKVPGWNEIDAVGLVDDLGTIHWATEATASSTYADRGGSQPLAPIDTPPDDPPAAETPEPSDSAMLLSHVDDSAEGKRSIAGSGHAVVFDRPAGANKVTAIQIFASRYGYPQPPDEDFHVYLLDEDQMPIKDLTFPYGTIARGPEKWYTLEVPSVEVPERFYVALSFNPERTKGIYLGYDESEGPSHSYTGLPNSGFSRHTSSPEAKLTHEWMVRARMAP